MRRLVYLSPVPWKSFAQRPHKFVDWFHSRYKGEVLWIDPYPTRFPLISDFRRFNSNAVKVTSTDDSAEKLPQWLTVLSPRSLPVEPLPLSVLLNRWLWKSVLVAIDTFMSPGDTLIGVGKPSKFALEVMRRNPSIPTLYDAMDEFPAFYRGLSRQAMTGCERKIAARATRILVSSTALAHRFAGYSSKLELALNACSLEVLPPINEATTKAEKPIIGYVGTIGQWFDWPLVAALADANPSVLIRLIGPVYFPSPVALPQNIKMLPACDHSMAIKEMQKFSIGLIPFLRNELTASVDPIKYYEYRALGLPVLSTNFGEMTLRKGEGGVFLLNELSDLTEMVRKALEYQAKSVEVLEFRSTNSWSFRFDSCAPLP